MYQILDISAIFWSFRISLRAASYLASGKKALLREDHHI